MSQYNLAGLKIDSVRKAELLTKITHRLERGEKTFVITPYSEFLYRSLQDKELLALLNKADFSVPDGIGMFWAQKFLSIPFSAKSFYGKIFQAFWQMVYSGAAIIFYPKWIKSAFAEKIPGSDLIWDLAKLVAQERKSVYLLGGFNDTAEIVAKKLKTQLLATHNLQLTIVGCSSKNPDDLIVVDDIKKTNPDFLFVAFGPIKQEKWIVEHMDELPCKFYIGLGGTFDYIAGKRLNPPRFVRSVGLEWLYRLITQPHRIKRIWQATVGLIISLVRYKVFSSMPYRPNVVCAILNKENKILICKRNPQGSWIRKFGFPKNDFIEHWQMPQGGADEGETFEQTARREAREEVGLANLTFIKVSDQKSSYIWNNAVRKLFQNAPYKGQEQTIVYLKYEGDVNSVIVDQNEFVDFQWVPLSELKDKVHAQRLELAEIVQQDLKDWS